MKAGKKAAPGTALREGLAYGWSSPNPTIPETSLPFLPATSHHHFADTAVLRECEVGQASRRQGAKSWLPPLTPRPMSRADRPCLVGNRAQSGCQELALFICSVTFTGM